MQFSLRSESPNLLRRSLLLSHQNSRRQLRHPRIDVFHRPLAARSPPTAGRRVVASSVSACSRTSASASVTPVAATRTRPRPPAAAERHRARPRAASAAACCCQLGYVSASAETALEHHRCNRHRLERRRRLATASPSSASDSPPPSPQIGSHCRSGEGTSTTSALGGRARQRLRPHLRRRPPHSRHAHRLRFSPRRRRQTLDDASAAPMALSRLLAQHPRPPPQSPQPTRHPPRCRGSGNNGLNRRLNGRAPLALAPPAQPPQLPPLPNARRRQAAIAPAPSAAPHSPPAPASHTASNSIASADGTALASATTSSVNSIRPRRPAAIKCRPADQLPASTTSRRPNNSPRRPHARNSVSHAVS